MFAIALATIALPSALALADDADPSLAPASEASASETDESATRADSQSGATHPSRPAPTLTRSGAPGLNRLQIFPGSETGSLILGAGGSYFGGSDVVENGDRVRRMTGWFGLTWRPLPQLEVFGTLQSRTATSTRTIPTLIHSIGNPGLGLRVGGPVARGLTLAGQLGWYVPSATDSTGLDFRAPRLELLGVATIDLDALGDNPLPLRLHVNTGPIIDRGRKLFDVDLTRPERFAHDITDYSRWRVGIGVEATLPWVAPYAEYMLDVALDPFCSNEIQQACVQDERMPAWPSVLTLGVRGSPAETFSLHSGVELGLSTRESQGTPAVPAWTWVFGLSWEIDPRGVRPPEPAPEPEPEPVLARITLEVVDAFSGEAIPGPLVSVPAEDASARIGDAQGLLRLPAIEEGTALDLRIEAEGWEPTTRSLTAEAGEQTLRIALDEVIEGARLSGRITLANPEAGAPMVQLRNADQLLEAPIDDAGNFSIDFAPGVWIVTMSGPGHVSRRTRVEFGEGRTDGEIVLRAQPDPNALRLQADAIAYPTERLRFEGAQPTLDSDPLLRDLASLLARHPEIELLLRVHVDDREDEAFERALARDRGEVLIEELDLLGVAPGRLQVEAVGAAEPIAPNISARDRARNNRVEFVILPPVE